MPIENMFDSVYLGFSFEFKDSRYMEMLCMLIHSGPENGMLTLCLFSVCGIESNTACMIP